MGIGDWGLGPIPNLIQIKLQNYFLKIFIYLIITPEKIKNK